MLAIRPRLIALACAGLMLAAAASMTGCVAAAAGGAAGYIVANEMDDD